MSPAPPRPSCKAHFALGITVKMGAGWQRKGTCGMVQNGSLVGFGVFFLKGRCKIEASNFWWLGVGMVGLARGATTQKYSDWTGKGWSVGHDGVGRLQHR